MTTKKGRVKKGKRLLNSIMVNPSKGFYAYDVKMAVEWLKLEYKKDTIKQAKSLGIRINQIAMEETMKLIESAFPDLYN